MAHTERPSASARDNEVRIQVNGVRMTPRRAETQPVVGPADRAGRTHHPLVDQTHQPLLGIAGAQPPHGAFRDGGRPTLR
jgi:hypothetical protein